MIVPPSGATTIAPMIAATGVLVQAERRDETCERQQDDERLGRPSKRVALGEQVVERCGAERQSGIGQRRMGRRPEPWDPDPGVASHSPAPPVARPAPSSGIVADRGMADTPAGAPSGVDVENAIPASTYR
jgi:hypothetical protein